MKNITVLEITLAIIVVLVVVFVALYNFLVRRKNQVLEAWSDILVQLKRRYDLIPNVVEAVKGYAGHERGLLENITKARVSVMGVQSPADEVRAENILSGALKNLFAVAENYPDLKANTNFLDLQRELADTEDKIQSARRFYNSVVRDYNTALETFPTNMVARLFGFVKKDLFDLSSSEEAGSVRVKF